MDPDRYFGRKLDNIIGGTILLVLLGLLAGIAKFAAWLLNF